ncbi:MAG: hypothetical protein K6V73_05685 [Firmicutes bacterium]|nr:hypothetical protein [Bacillota bacterium]
MRRTGRMRGLLLSLCAAALVAVGRAPGVAAAASGSSGVVGSETWVFVPQAAGVRVLVNVDWDRLPVGPKEFVPLPGGFTLLRVIGTTAPFQATASGVWLSGRPKSVQFDILLPRTSPLVWSETTAAPIASATLLVGGGAYPSGSALGTFTYRGVVHLAGQNLREFQAAAVPAGTSIFIPMALGDPAQVYRGWARAGLLLLGLAALAFAVVWAGRQTGSHLSDTEAGGA